MSKSNSKTIADLSINWTFDWGIDTSILVKIQELNPEIFSLKIVRNTYYFLIDDLKFSVQVIDNDTLADLIYCVDGRIFNLQNSKNLPNILVLDRFEFIEENTFRIHVKS